MNFQFHVSGIVLFANTILCAYLAVMMWIRQVKPGGGSFAVLMLSLAVWSLAAALEDGSVDYAFKYSCSKISYLGIATSPALFLIFALEYNRFSNWMTRRNLAFLWVIPVISLLMAFTNEKHLLLWSSVVPSPGTNGEILVYNHGIYFWVHVAFSYICLLTANVVMIRSALLLSRKVRSQVYLLFIAALIPWIGNIIYISGLSPIRGLDLTPISFTLSAMLLAWSVFRLQLFGIIPVARDLVIETTNDGIVVVDADDQVLDVNAAAIHTLFPDQENPIGSNLNVLLKDHAEVLLKIKNVTDGSVEIDFKAKPTQFLDVNVTPLRDQNGFMNGRILVIRDITDRKLIQKEEHEQRTLAESLRDIAAALISLRGVDEVLERILLDVKKVVPHDASSIAILREGNQISFARSRGHPNNKLNRALTTLSLKLDDVYTYRTMARSQKPLIIDDTRKDPKWIILKDSEWIRSYVGAPILIGGKVIGFINLDARKSGFFTERSADMLQAFANHAALALENARLFEQLEILAITDGLTGLFNQRHFEEVASREIQRAVRYKKPLSLVMMDIDHFKLVNDQYGHRAGDQALQMISKIFLDSLRKIDLISRYGGEEFTILLPDTDLAGAGVLADRLRLSIASSPLVLPEGLVRVTCSLGVASLQSCPPNLKDMINCADKALYEAKKAGRNQVKLFAAVNPEK
jgi:diguanylate cyclase (GGDEF)-like protein/PAS domain S-box-containing protein